MQARVIVPVASVREEPNSPIQVAEQYSQRLFGDVVTTGEVSGKHTAVTYETGQGWIRSSYLKPHEGPPPKPNFIAVVPRVSVFAADRITLHQHLAFGTRLLATDRGDGWISFLSVRGEQVFGRRENFKRISELTYSPEDAMRRLELFLGTPYLWGGITPYGADCSGLIIAIARFYGYDGFPHSAGQQSKTGTTIELKDAKAMDLLYFPGHAGIYLGDGRFIHANTLRGCVSIDTTNPDDPAYHPVIEELTVVNHFPLA